MLLTFKKIPGLWKSVIFILVSGTLAVTAWYITSKKQDNPSVEPLYWVAPMDPNYQRNEPGLSPMGMELVPVYPGEQSPAVETAAKYKTRGETHISPDVQLKMGVKTANAELGQLQQKLQVHGHITFDNTMVDKLSPRVTGWIDELYVDGEGEMVKRGQALFSLYSPEFIEHQEAFLLSYNSGDKKAALKAESKLKALNMDEQAIENLKQYGVAQRGVVFHAQKDGVVGKLWVSAGDYVEPGTHIMAIGTLERVVAELNIFSSKASLIQRGQLVSVTTTSYPGVFWEGEVDYIQPALNHQDRSIQFRAIIDNPEMKLRPNMPIQAEIELPDRAEALLIPYQAVIRLGFQDRVVWALPNNRFKSVEVTLGESNGEQIEVLDGLVEGDKIVSSAQFLIDSESSKVSDFIRISTKEQGQYRPTRVIATVLDINFKEKTLRLKHEAIKAWKMPAMTMVFQATDSVDLKSLKKGQRVRVFVANGDPLFLALEVSPIGK